MDIVDIDIKDLKPSDYNPRLLTEKAKAEIWESILQFGMVEPIVVNNAKGRENVIIGGHQRWYVCKEMGKKTMPVVYVTIDDLEREKELNLRLNKNVGDWNWDELANFDEDLLRTVGFDEELDKLFQKDIEEDEAPAVSEGEPDSKLGEVYQLGKHRLMCGDATKIEDVKKLMDGQKADMVFTDPPYNVDYGGDQSPVWKQGIRKIENDNLTPETWVNFCKDIITMIELFNNGSIYVCHAPAPDGRVIATELDKIFHWSATIIWKKDRLIPGRGHFQRQYEPIWYGWKGEHREQKDRTATDVWEITRAFKNDLHPTMKPVSLVARAINYSSFENQKVLDLFGGSGSTLIACEQTNRTCYMMELSCAYIDVIIKRWENFTGQKVVKLNQGIQTEVKTENITLDTTEKIEKGLPS